MMVGLEVAPSINKFQEQDGKYQRPITTQNYKLVENPAACAVLIRKFVRTISLEDDLCDTEVQDILSDSPEEKALHNYAKLDYLDEDLVTNDRGDLSMPLKKVPKTTEHSFNTSTTPRASSGSVASPSTVPPSGSRTPRRTMTPSSCYTVDMATGIVSPIQITSNTSSTAKPFDYLKTRETTRASKNEEPGLALKPSYLPQESFDNEADTAESADALRIGLAAMQLHLDRFDADDRPPTRIRRSDPVPIVRPNFPSVPQISPQQNGLSAHEYQQQQVYEQIWKSQPNNFDQGYSMGLQNSHQFNNSRVKRQAPQQFEEQEFESPRQDWIARDYVATPPSQHAAPPVNTQRHYYQQEQQWNHEQYQAGFHRPPVYDYSPSPHYGHVSHQQMHQNVQQYTPRPPSYGHNEPGYPLPTPPPVYAQDHHAYNYHAQSSQKQSYPQKHHTFSQNHTFSHNQMFSSQNHYAYNGYVQSQQAYQPHQNYMSSQPTHNALPYEPVTPRVNGFNNGRPSYKLPHAPVVQMPHHAQQYTPSSSSSSSSSFAASSTYNSSGSSGTWYSGYVSGAPQIPVQRPRQHTFAQPFSSSDITLPSSLSSESSMGLRDSDCDDNTDVDESKAAQFSKRSELVESLTIKQSYKQFSKQFKSKEKEGLEAAKAFAKENMDQLNEQVHWKVYLELADLAKRENHLRLARKFYQRVVHLEPCASQGWLEYAKMEEECGELSRCQGILARGLECCPFNESLLVKGIKHEERMGNLSAARSLLARLRTQSIDKGWRTIMEGAMLEARAGNTGVARKIFKYLINNVPWYGPIYQEAYRLEENCEEYERAITIVEKGLFENQRYGPLWFSALRLYEKTSHGFLQTTRNTVERARQAISKELMWKVYFEAAQIEERAGNLGPSRAAYVKCVEHCPESVLWKVWLGGSRTELNYDNILIARKLLTRSLKEVPVRMRVMVLLECSRLEEYAGNVDQARRILQKAKSEAKHEWKVFLESVLLEMRAGNTEAAVSEAKEALKIHSGTGRLWAVLIQLKQSQGIHAQLRVFQKALREVPKSGEVWCEGARIALNNNEMADARRFLDFAIQFTPQYGDSFIEYLRLELFQDPNADISKLEQSCVNADPNYGTMWLHSKKHPLDSTRQVLRNAKQILVDSTPNANTIILSDKESSGADEDDRFSGCQVGRDGILSLDQAQSVSLQLTNDERRKLIFGSEQIKL